MSGLSIRWRLTLWNTLAAGALLVSVGLLVYGLLRHAMYEQVDRLLLSQFRELESDQRMQADPEGRLRHWIEEFYDHVGLFCVIYDPQGAVLARTEQLVEQSVPDSPQAFGEDRFDSVRLPLIGHQRVLARQLETAGRSYGVVLMTPLAEVDEELNRIAAVLWSVLPMALLLAGGVGYLLARKALAPVDQLRTSTDQITAERLSQRLQIANPSDEIGRLGQTINAMIARLEWSFTEIRRFTADASHELRTPISVIRTEMEVAMNKPLGAEQYQSLAGSILEECEQLTKLTDQLLMLSREDAGITPFVPQRLNLTVLVRDATEMMRPLAEAKQQNLSIRSEGDGEVVGDAGRLRQVVYNVLDNAIKYTPPSGSIEVAVRPHGGMLAIIVSDTGIGIAEEHVSHVFERFYRVDKARSRNEGGTGLGLSIVKSIAVAHGGRVEIASAVGKGTTCTVLLPREDAERR